MSDEIELISDGDGVAIIGEPGAVERFIATLQSTEKLEAANLGTVLTIGSFGAQVGSHVAENSGRWLKLTKDSAEQLKRIGLIETGTPGIKYAMLGKPGDIAK
jgi:hypothetical protein